MTRPASQIYRSTLPAVSQQLTAAIARGCSEFSTIPTVFFRGDDIGIPSHEFAQMIAVFRKHKIPLSLAVVPTWLNTTRLSDLQNLMGNSKTQWYWHQHGYIHHNFELLGKKQEFGPSRAPQVIHSSLTKGKARLDMLLGPDNQPVFTPPWNRCSQETLHGLQALNFKAISRSRGATPHTKENFPDFQMNVDLHTRKEACPKQGFEVLLGEIEQGLATGRCGIMLHHQRMNGRAVAFLDILLQCLKKHPRISFVHFGDLLP
ncbi:MAG: hypothetical protein COA36_10310 [Desulfotalea sp.]|nr:MAG: hypothetical protein COA36_10310 [Desulfotalea sp.]